MIIDAANRATAVAHCPACHTETYFHDATRSGLCRSSYCSDTCISQVIETVWASKGYWVRVEFNEGFPRIAEWKPLREAA